MWDGMKLPSPCVAPESALIYTPFAALSPKGVKSLLPNIRSQRPTERRSEVPLPVWGPARRMGSKFFSWGNEIDFGRQAVLKRVRPLYLCVKNYSCCDGRYPGARSRRSWCDTYMLSTR